MANKHGTNDGGGKWGAWPHSDNDQQMKQNQPAQFEVLQILVKSAAVGF